MTMVKLGGESSSSMLGFLETAPPIMGSGRRSFDRMAVKSSATTSLAHTTSTCSSRSRAQKTELAPWQVVVGRARERRGGRVLSG